MIKLKVRFTVTLSEGGGGRHVISIPKNPLSDYAVAWVEWFSNKWSQKQKIRAEESTSTLLYPTLWVYPHTTEFKCLPYLKKKSSELSIIHPSSYQFLIPTLTLTFSYPFWVRVISALFKKPISNFDYLLHFIA